MSKAFDQERLRRFYDRMGSKQDSQGFYENVALDALIRQGDFARAESILEIGCGTGKFAARLLSDHVSDRTHYVGIDISPTMAGIARERLAPWSERARVCQSDGGFDFGRFGGPFDRIIFTYVFDLLSPEQIDAALSGAHAVAENEGLLCACGLTKGIGPLSSATSAVWTFVHKLSPYSVGGCRPLELAERISASHWRLSHREVVVAASIPSEIIIAKPG